jgi:hypothetical protein
MTRTGKQVKEATFKEIHGHSLQYMNAVAKLQLNTRCSKKDAEAALQLAYEQFRANKDTMHTTMMGVYSEALGILS